jgi:hypothetical protein
MRTLRAQKAKNGANMRQKGAICPLGRAFERKAADALAAREYIAAAAKKRYVHASHHLSLYLSFVVRSIVRLFEVPLLFFHAHARLSANIPQAAACLHTAYGQQAS